MNMKEAQKLAKKHDNANWVAGDKDKTIWIFQTKPYRYNDTKEWLEHRGSFLWNVRIGKYTGKKSWKKTLRKVK